MAPSSRVEGNKVTSTGRYHTSLESRRGHLAYPVARVAKSGEGGTGIPEDFPEDSL